MLAFLSQKTQTETTTTRGQPAASEFKWFAKSTLMKSQQHGRFFGCRRQKCCVRCRIRSPRGVLGCKELRDGGRRRREGDQSGHCGCDGEMSPSAHGPQSPTLGFCFPIPTAAPAVHGWVCPRGHHLLHFACGDGHPCNPPWDSLKNSPVTITASVLCSEPSSDLTSCNLCNPGLCLTPKLLQKPSLN